MFYGGSGVGITGSSDLLYTPGGGLTIPSASGSVSANTATANFIGLNDDNGQLFSDGNFHIHSRTGQMWLNTLDSSNVAIGTQYNSGSGASLVVERNITSNTTGVGHSFFFKNQTAANANFGTNATLDNLICRLDGTGSGNDCILQAATVSGTFTAYVSAITNRSGTGPIGNTNSSGITFTTTFQNISAAGGGSITLSVGGDMFMAQLMDLTNQRVYRITAMHNADNTGHIAIERLA